jgi:glycosyltransferase involved in cell wall biosynthesis
MPETAGGAAFLANPDDPRAISAAILRACEGGEDMRTRGLARAAQFTWAQTGKSTLEVYREVHANRKAKR